MKENEVQICPNQPKCVGIRGSGRRQPSPAAALRAPPISQHDSSKSSLFVSLNSLPGRLFLSNDWLMDEANGRGVAQWLMSRLSRRSSACATRLTDYLDLPFTSQYADIGALRWSGAECFPKRSPRQRRQRVPLRRLRTTARGAPRLRVTAQSCTDD